MDNKKDIEINAIKETKTADYTRRAVDNYHNKKDLFSLALKKGTKDAIRAKHGDIKLNDYFQTLVDADLNAGAVPEPAQKRPPKKSATDRAAIIDDPAQIFENYKDN